MTPMPYCTTIYEASQHNDVTKIQELLFKGIDPNCCEDDANVTPLHYAAQGNAYEAALLLITAGASLHSETSDGYTPLEIAKLNNNKKMITLFNKMMLFK